MTGLAAFAGTKHILLLFIVGADVFFIEPEDDRTLSLLREISVEYRRALMEMEQARTQSAAAE